MNIRKSPNARIKDYGIKSLSLHRKLNKDEYEDSDVGFLAAHKSGVPNKNIIDVNNEFAFNKFVGIDEFKKMIKNNQIK